MPKAVAEQEATLRASLAACLASCGSGQKQSGEALPVLLTLPVPAKMADAPGAVAPTLAAAEKQAKSVQRLRARLQLPETPEELLTATEVVRATCQTALGQLQEALAALTAVVASNPEVSCWSACTTELQVLI